MKFFQKTGVAVTITVLAVVAALVIGILSGLSSAWSLLRPKKPSKPPQTTVHFNDHS